MAFTTREIESPDPVTRVAAADAECATDLGESAKKWSSTWGRRIRPPTEYCDSSSNSMVKSITKATPDIGFLHRGDEKIAENMQYNQFVPYTDRLDYLAPLANNVAYALAVEKLMGWELPPRGKAIRVICCETSRISSHLLGLGAMALDLGAMTVFLYTFTEREKLYDLFELLTGARFTTSYTRVGGQIRDLPRAFHSATGKVSRWFHSASSMRSTSSSPEIAFSSIARETLASFRAIARSPTRFPVRICAAAASNMIFRRKHPYLDYEKYDFEVVVGTAGDCYDRYLVRIEEMRQSAHILRR